MNYGTYHVVRSIKFNVKFMFLVSLEPIKLSRIRILI
jgi:hypothetical protein